MANKFEYLNVQCLGLARLCSVEQQEKTNKSDYVTIVLTKPSG